ncbi:pectin lyase-like protein [Corynespora cassiicola Philippines]|uniref:Pectin lyase-like protein n=1 Tax=Corynespora cassiicola Philippines TaxID=1448308 RepID=A0A2T2NZD6_CORCC|nr:pectin lyase-like protein [Corynespora cassiicola Philippines]
MAILGPRFFPYIAILSLALAGISISAPSPALIAPDKVAKRATCTPTSAGSASIDDVPSIKSALSQCGNGGTIVLPAGTTYMLNSQLDLSACHNCDIQLEGRLKASPDVDFWNNKRWMIQFNGAQGARFRSLTGTGEIDGNGQTAYDRFAADTSLKRPALFVISNSSDISVSGFTAKNAQAVFFSTGSGSSRLSFDHLTLTANSKSEYPPKNTDGFAIGSSTYVTMSDIYVQNQDDCIGFKAGLNYLTATDIECVGSHGLSVGSLAKAPGSFDPVENVYVKGAIMRDSSKAAGIKIYPGGELHGDALVRNVTWEDVTVDNCNYAFQYAACYNEDEEYCEANPSPAEVTEIYVKNFHGTTSSRYAPTVGEVYCPAEGPNCEVHVSDWAVTAPGGTSEFLCDKITSSELGTTCTQIS